MTVCAGSMQATTLLTNTLVANVAAMPVAGVTCSTVTGPPLVGQTITIRAFPAPSGTNTVTVGVIQTPGIKVTLPASVVLSLNGNTSVAGSVANATGIVLTVNSTAGCSNASGIVANTLVSGANVIAVSLTAQSTGGTANADNGLTVTNTITSTTSALVAANVTVTCGNNAGGLTFVAGAPQTVAVTSAANLGTPVVVTTGGLPSWLVLGPVAPAGTAGTSAFNFTVQATPIGTAAVPVQAATIAVLSNTPTYVNGTAGVGATLTATSNGVLVIDGYTVLLNDRILVKTQAAPADNGVYTVTTLGTGGVDYVLTRATDFNTIQAINGSGTIAVVNGGTNAGTNWVPSASVVTIGTTSLTYGAGTAAPAGCGAFTTNQTFSLPLTSAPAPAVNVTITLRIVTTLSPLTVTPVPASPTISITYTKGSGTPGVANVNVTSTLPNAYASLNTATLPIWLTVNITAATIPIGGKALQFSTTTQTDSLAPGNYTTTVFISVSGYADYAIPINLLVTNKPAKLSITSANPMPVAYTLGGTTPVSTIIVASSDSPIPYTITLGGPLAPQLTAGEQLTGIAYSFGTSVNIAYNSLIFSTSAPGTVISGTVTFTWGNPASVVVVTINLTVGSAGAVISGISPATLPTAAPGSVYHVTILGSGFVGGSDPTLATKVGIVSGSNPATLNLDTNFKVTYNSPANLDLQITVPSLGLGGVNGDSNLPFLVGGAGGPVFLGVANGSTTIPTGTQTLTIGAGPIIYGVTSSSSFTEVSGGNLPQIAPYDMISIFGSSFCSSVNTGCTSTQILNTGPDTVTLRFPFALSPDVQPAAPALDNRRQLTVNFYPHGTLAGALPAPLLFATNGQINTIVPGAVTAAPTLYDIVVSFGCPLCTPSTVVSSAPFPVNTVAVDPGIFTVGSDGQGAAAALASGTYALISNISPAGMRFTAPQSDTIQIYMTGLGVPPSAAAYTSNNGACIAPLGGGYLAALAANTAAASGFTTIDGDVLQTALFSGTTPDLPPCLTVEPTVTVGGVTTPAVSYAAFVGDTVAGLYQINVQLPATQNTLYPNFPSLSGPLTNLTGPTELPVFVTLGGKTSQAGVRLSVTPKLLMTLSGNTFVAGTTTENLSIGHVMTSFVITATNNGVSTNVKYAVTSGVLPQGLTLTFTSPGGVATIAGTPAQLTAGSYPITVTATDTSAIPITGSSTFTLYVPGGLFVTAGSITSSTFGTANTAMATVTPVGGTTPYNQFAITTPATPITGLSITTGGILQTDGTTPAGTYTITVTATDAAGTMGTVAFTFIVKLLVVYSPISPVSISLGGLGAGGTIDTLTVSGGVGPYTYAVDASSTAAAAAAGALNFVLNVLQLGTDVTVSTQTVVIDVVDTGSPVSSANVDTVTGTAGAQFTLVVIAGS